MPAASDSSACFQRVGLTMAFFPLRNPLCDGTTANDKHGHPTLNPQLATPLSASSSRCHAPPTCRIQDKSIDAGDAAANQGHDARMRNIANPMRPTEQNLAASAPVPQLKCAETPHPEILSELGHSSPAFWMLVLAGGNRSSRSPNPGVAVPCQGRSLIGSPDSLAAGSPSCLAETNRHIISPKGLGSPRSPAAMDGICANGKRPLARQGAFDRREAKAI